MTTEERGLHGGEGWQTPRSSRACGEHAGEGTKGNLAGVRMGWIPHSRVRQTRAEGQPQNHWCNLPKWQGRDQEGETQTRGDKDMVAKCNRRGWTASRYCYQRTKKPDWGLSPSWWRYSKANSLMLMISLRLYEIHTQVFRGKNA